MGCDIHIVLERRSKDDGDAVNQWKEAIFGAQWVGVYCTDDLPYPVRPKIADRNYSFFREIANVRGKGTYMPRGLPQDISLLTRQTFDRCPNDYHSASHMTVPEFTNVWLKVYGQKYGDDNTREKVSVYDLVGPVEENGKYEYRVVFWFDN